MRALYEAKMGKANVARELFQRQKNVNYASHRHSTQTAPNQISFATRSNMMWFYCVGLFGLMEATVVMDA